MIEVFDVPEEYKSLLKSLAKMDRNDGSRSGVIDEINRIREIALGLGISREEFERIYGPVIPFDEGQLRNVNQ